VRIIAGTARGRSLKSVPGEHIRPTADRVREAIFSIIYSRLGSWRNRTVLDLCSGTGAMAIEALSRGAARAVLVDRDARAERLARQNLESCRLEQPFEFIRGSLPQALAQLPPGPYDVVFLDPPYRQGIAGATLELLGRSEFLNPDSLVCVETGKTDQLNETYGNLAVELQRDYGSTRISLFALTE